MGIFGSDFETKFTKSLRDLPLSDYEKNIIISRYISIVIKAETDYYCTWLAYTVMTNLVTIAGVLVASLISLEKVVESPNIMFWITWGLSIALTIANKLLYVYNIHKKYVLGIIMLEKYYSEGWSFISGIGRYDDYNFDSRFKLFTSRIERLKMKSLENAPEVESMGSSADIIASGTERASPATNSIDASIIPDASDNFDAIIDVHPLPKDDRSL